MYSVITTIQQPTEAVIKINKLSKLIIVFDKKTPNDWFSKEPVFEIICGTNPTDFKVDQFLPFNHYSRKNLGYLSAMQVGAELIYDTDDDNIPNENWKPRSVEVEAAESVGTGWYNVYDLLTDTGIWPRGFSITKLPNKPSCGITRKFSSSIQQGLSDGEPDVDAVWRLTNKRGNNIFARSKSVYLHPGVWCPFNSQSTWWFPKVYPLMYLPVTASFRMTDIWRSFVAQRCLWEMGEGVTFHSPAEVFQDRNKHDLLKDFEDEVPGYLNNDKIVSILSELKLQQGAENTCLNLLTCYKALVEAKIFPHWELRSVNAWVKDIRKVQLQADDIRRNIS